MATPAQLTCQRELFGSPSSDANNSTQKRIRAVSVYVCVCTHIRITFCVGACVLTCASLCVRVRGSLTSAFEFCLSSLLGTGFYSNFRALWMKLQCRKLDSLWLSRCCSSLFAKLSNLWLIWSKIEYRMFAWTLQKHIRCVPRPVCVEVSWERSWVVPDSGWLNLSAVQPLHWGSYNFG